MIMDEGSGLREGYAGVGDQRLHYVEAGEGPLIVLLHGFPEFWYGWRLPDASHWVHHDEAERVNALLIDFFAPRPASQELTGTPAGADWSEADG
jgi:pimeloyl-ACP methyl ester carboxylesterase